MYRFLEHDLILIAVLHTRPRNAISPLQTSRLLLNMKHIIFKANIFMCYSFRQICTKRKLAELTRCFMETSPEIPILRALTNYYEDSWLLKHTYYWIHFLSTLFCLITTELSRLPRPERASRGSLVKLVTSFHKEVSDGITSARNCLVTADHSTMLR